jgi:hypothetical protein
MGKNFDFNKWSRQMTKQYGMNVIKTIAFYPGNILTGVVISPEKTLHHKLDITIYDGKMVPK